jgi:hypothetical protein
VELAFDKTIDSLTKIDKKKLSGMYGVLFLQNCQMKRIKVENRSFAKPVPVTGDSVHGSCRTP